MAEGCIKPIGPVIYFGFEITLCGDPMSCEACQEQSRQWWQEEQQRREQDDRSQNEG